MNPDIAVLILIVGLVLGIIAVICIIRTAKPSENKKSESKKASRNKKSESGDDKSSYIIGNFGKSLNEVKLDIALNINPKKATEIKFEKIDNTPKRYEPEESPYETPKDDPMYDPDAFWFREKYDYKWKRAKNGEEYYTRRTR